MEEINKTFEAAVADGRIQGVSLLAKDLTGKVNISRSYGVRSLCEQLSEQRPPMTIDTPMRFASASKFLTSVMVLQCVEKGFANLDEGLEKLLPEVAGLKVITGFDEAGNSIEREPKSPMTLRHILSHSSGLGYALTSPPLRQYRQNKGLEIDQGYDTLDQNFGYPLIFDPGDNFAYGPGLDWSARLISRASGMSMEDFMQQHLAAPLGIGADDMTFELQKHPGTQARRSDMTVRVDVKDGNSGRLQYQDETYWHHDREPHGGQGIYTTPEAYMKVLWSILSDDGKLLKPETRKLLFKPSLTPLAEKGLDEYCETYREWVPCAPLPAEIEKSHSLGGLITLEDSDGDNWRRKGDLSWAGLPNIYWHIDQEAGLCSLTAFHMKPWGDPICRGLGEMFERATYAMLKE